ncbi:PD-(D/E)XK nuclease superfamily protein [Mycoplasma todarodis]|uniref:PD-(D/E)XK nuclease domain-containing protein n=1 Tax=Mycoplasma todarodis TaxID=1937191 RepID=A0A4R0XTI9_9MOLU|nr:PD-(D/E)XK nuclease superfamily protein [Mycoplasma todarodis]TCG11077.1 hypothetical protein C4B25_02410 [Mycoplasma todarodis]
MNNIKINKGTGAGGAKTNLNGLKWEESTYLGNALKTLGYNLELTDEIKKIKKGSTTTLLEIRKNDEHFGYYGQQGQLYKMLQLVFPNKMNNEFIETVLSKKINPDGFIYNSRTNTLHIFEKKWQQVPGSVDEKLQTAPFKRTMFKKLLSNVDTEVTYQYILSSYFKQKQYENIKEYYESLVNEKEKYGVWIQNLNLDQLKIEDFLK